MPVSKRLTSTMAARRRRGCHDNTPRTYLQAEDLPLQLALKVEKLLNGELLVQLGTEEVRGECRVDALQGRARQGSVRGYSTWQDGVQAGIAIL